MMTLCPVSSKKSQEWDNLRDLTMGFDNVDEDDAEDLVLHEQIPGYKWHN